MILHHEIRKLTRRLLEIGTIVEKRVDIAVKSIVRREKLLAKEVIDGDVDVDQMEVDLEEDCLKILALHQPVAVDLRMIIAVLKINNDLERIGDLAVDAAERALALIEQKPVDFPFDFPLMSQRVQALLQQALDALVNLDMDAAIGVCASDDAVDDMHAEMFQKVEQAIIKNPPNIQQLLTYLSVSRYLERIADHSTNIAEDVIYLIKGNIVRHKGSIY